MRIRSRAALVAALLFVLAVRGADAAGSPQPVRPSVLIVTTFQFGDPARAGAGEATRWVTRDRLTRRIAIAGLSMPLYCDASAAECLIVTGMGKVNAAASMLVAGTSDRLDLRRTSILVAGIAGTSPHVASIGSVAWAEWVVDGDIANEVDPREPFAGTQFSRSRLGCGRPWCDTPWRTNTELFHLNASLRDWAFGLSKTVRLSDSARVRKHRAHFARTAYGDRPSAVRTCDVLSGDTYWQGAIMSSFATWWLAKWTGGRGQYCMTAMEESGILGGVQRLGASHRADPARVMVLRGASDYDRPYAGQTAGQALLALNADGGVELALDNLYAAGEPVVKALLGRSARNRNRT